MAARQQPGKEIRYVRTPIRPTSVANFRFGLKLLFNPLKAENVSLTIQFRLQGQRDHFVTRWSKFDTLWEGVSVRALIDQGLIRLKPAARYVMQHAEYGFTVNLPLELVLADNFLLATHFDGQPLTPDHGYPVRGVIGNLPGVDLKTPYFWKGAKWVRSLEFMKNDRLGFWEQAGYHNRADVWEEERFG